jgi:hypothetical protein
MKEDFKKWLCEKADYMYSEYFNYIETLYILTKAMWAINRENNYRITITQGGCYSQSQPWKDLIMKYYLLKDYNNSEQEALEKALEYIYEQENK